MRRESLIQKVATMPHTLQKCYLVASSMLASKRSFFSHFGSFRELSSFLTKCSGTSYSVSKIPLRAADTVISSRARHETFFKFKSLYFENKKVTNQVLGRTVRKLYAPVPCAALTKLVLRGLSHYVTLRERHQNIFKIKNPFLRISNYTIMRIMN